MLILVTHFTLLALLSTLVHSETTPQVSSFADADGDFGFFESRGNANDTLNLDIQLQDQMVQCIGAMRGILLTAGVHLEPRIEAIGQCPVGTDSKLANLCSTDYHESADPAERLQEKLLSALNAGNGQNLGKELHLVIRKVSPVLDATSGIIYANKYCAQCHHAKTRNLPRKILCARVDDIMKCFVTAQMPDKLKYCHVDKPTPRFFFSWDSIFTLPEEEEDEEDGGSKDSAQSTEDRVFEILQWICCVFSIVALILAICVFSTSPRLKRPLPGKMMIALCCALLGSVVFFILASEVMEVIPFLMRPLCVTLAWFLLLFLLSSFVWMVMFSIELCRTFGLTRLFRQIFFCYCYGKDGERKGNATSVMLRARGSDPATSTRFHHQIVASVVVPLCIGIPALAINESAYSRIKPIYDASANKTSFQGVEEAELGSSLYRVNPNFCPVNKPNYAWFRGHYTALLIWFLVPSGVMICFNVLTLIVVCIQICRLKKETELSHDVVSSLHDSQKNVSKSLVAVCGKLAAILGASWFIQILASLCPHLLLVQKIAGLMTSAQGGAVAISMLAGSKARKVMARWLPKRWQEGLGVSESTTRGMQEVTNSARSKSRITGQTSSTQTTSLLQNSNS
ncbi:unnamed protein product [Hymenolepis diminuta]|uniref:G_PROTEIN_RECEP_F2_4 domain-containing protein n=1 Tax=Hymenolepis diminuta TaxID=6216 RepID=A0A0R3SR90_HYMDI|nr:unnamed protein product [Hymenolepis diminuta]